MFMTSSDQFIHIPTALPFSVLFMTLFFYPSLYSLMHYSKWKFEVTDSDPVIQLLFMISISDGLLSASC